MARRRAFLLCGQSNAAGKGSVASLASLSGSRWASTSVYQNLWFWQNDCMDFRSDRGRIVQLDLTNYNLGAVADSSYGYIPNQTYIDPLSTAVPATFGPELEISRGYAEESYTTDEDGKGSLCIKLGLDATFMSPWDPVELPAPLPVVLPATDWYWPSLFRSWHPSYPACPPSPIALTAVASGTIGSTSTLTSAPYTIQGVGASWGADELNGKWFRATWADGNPNNVRSAIAIVRTSSSPSTLTVDEFIGGTPPVGAAFSVFTGTSDVLGISDTIETRTDVLAISEALVQVNSAVGTSTSVVGAGGTTLQDNTPGTWTPNQFAGKTGTITGGLGAGATFSVVSNTADTLTLSADWTTNGAPSGIDLTSTYTVGDVWTTNEHAGRWVDVSGNLGLITSNTTDTLAISPLGGGVYMWTSHREMGSTPWSFPADGIKIKDIRFAAGSLAKVLIEHYCVAADATLQVGGDRLDVQDIYFCIGESDSTEQARADRVYDNMKAIIAYMRTKLVELGLTSLPAHKIRVILAKVKNAASWTHYATTNAAFDRLAENDTAVTVVEVNDFPYGGFSGGDQQHYNAAGLLLLGRAMYEAGKTLELRETQATTDAGGRLTLSQIRTRVRRRYERTAATSELTDPQLDGYINDSLRDIYQMCGDNAWFLRQMSTVTISGSIGQETTLPRHIRRVYRIEDPSHPGVDIQWRATGYDEQGRTRVILYTRSAGTFLIHHFLMPADLGSDTDPCLVPPDYMELVILHACKRAAETAGNASQAGMFAMEAARVEQRVKQDLNRYDRPRKPALTTFQDEFGFEPFSFRAWESGWNRH